MKPAKIVLISGKQGSGKSTLSEALGEKWFSAHHKNMVYAIKFADAIYEMHNACIEILEKYTKPRGLVKDGPLLQLLGTDWGRKTLGENIWVDMLKGRIAERLQYVAGVAHEHCLIIVDDCRFKNELEGIPGALRVRLECDRGTRKKRCSAWRDNEMHLSEIDLDDWVYQPGKFDMIFNTGTQSTKEIVGLIMAQLDKNVWLEKRGSKNAEP